MQQQQKLECSGFAPSFSCYSSDSLTSRALAKVIREEDEARFRQNGDVKGDDFEFSLMLSDEEDSLKETDSQSWTVSNRDVLINDEIDRKISGTLLRKLFIGEPEDSSSYSSSEADEFEIPRSGTKCKKNNSTGSGSKRWIFRYLLRRSNKEGKEPRKMDSPKQKRNYGEVSKSGSRKVQTPVHEQFYVQRRAENEVGKRRSYLPYRKDLVGLFANVNGMGKMLPFLNN